MQPITILGVALFFIVLWVKYRSQPRNRPSRSREQKLKTAKVLFAALLAWMTIYFGLQRLNANLDGIQPEESFMERAVAFLSK